MTTIATEPRMFEHDFGPCCRCGRCHDVRNILMLSRRAPTPGKGWGCVVCGLPADGAVAVLCDDCVASGEGPRFVCTGYPATDGRTPIEETSDEPFDHDETKHAEEAIEL
jgi:hypothetical protein